LSTAHVHPVAPPSPGLPPEQRRAWDGTLPLELAGGDYLYFPGDPPRSVFLVRSGTVRIGRLLDAGSERTLDLAGPGDLVGEGAVLGEGQRQGFAQAVGPARVSPLPAPVLEAALRRNPDLAAAVARLVAERARRLEARLVESAFADCRRRLASVLLDVAGRFGADEEPGRRVTVRLTHEELARLIGAVRETVTPLLGELRRERLIDYDRRSLRLLDLAGLRRIAAGG